MLPLNNYTNLAYSQTPLTPAFPGISTAPNNTILIARAIDRITKENSNPSPVFRSLDNSLQKPFGEELFCSVTQEPCDFQNFYIFERRDGSLDIVYGVSSEAIANDIKNKYQYYPAANGEPSRQIINYHKLSDKLAMLPLSQQEEVKKLTDLSQVGQALRRPTESDTYINNNFLEVSSKIKQVLEENLAEFKKFDQNASVNQIKENPSLIAYQVGGVFFIYSDNRLNEGVMCPKNKEELIKNLKIDVSSFALFHSTTMIKSVNETRIVLKNGKPLETNLYIEDNGESLTINIEKFMADLNAFQNNLTYTGAIVYRSLGAKVTFSGF